MTERTGNHLTILGHPATLPESPAAAILERIPNPASGKHYNVRLTCPEFTSLCPMTGQPDFALIVVDYVPNAWIVESKSFKLFMGSYRNHGAFHESCTMDIADRLVGTLDPVWFRIGAYWYPRGGIPIDIFWQTGPAPASAWIPRQEVPSYRGRG